MLSATILPVSWFSLQEHPQHVGRVTVGPEICLLNHCLLLSSFVMKDGREWGRGRHSRHVLETFEGKGRVKSQGS